MAVSHAMSPKQRSSLASGLSFVTFLNLWIVSGVTGRNGALATNANMEKGREQEKLYRLLHMTGCHAKGKRSKQPKGAAPIACVRTLFVVGVIGILGAIARERVREDGKCADALWSCQNQIRQKWHCRKGRDSSARTRNCGRWPRKMEANAGKISAYLFVVAWSSSFSVLLSFEKFATVIFALALTGC